MVEKMIVLKMIRSNMSEEEFQEHMMRELDD
jgi:hypothetical protein